MFSAQGPVPGGLCPAFGRTRCGRRPAGKGSPGVEQPEGFPQKAAWLLGAFKPWVNTAYHMGACMSSAGVFNEGIVPLPFSRPAGLFVYCEGQKAGRQNGWWELRREIEVAIIEQYGRGTRSEGWRPSAGPGERLAQGLMPPIPLQGLSKARKLKIPPAPAPCARGGEGKVNTTQ